MSEQELARAKYEAQIMREEMERVEHEYALLENSCHECSGGCDVCGHKSKLDAISQYYGELIEAISRLCENDCE